MSVLQGFTNVLGRASDMSYRRDQAQNRRDQLDLYERNLELDEEKRAQENICLLYTSPSPRDRTRSRMPSSA